MTPQEEKAFELHYKLYAAMTKAVPHLDPCKLSALIEAVLKVLKEERNS